VTFTGCEKEHGHGTICIRPMSSCPGVLPPKAERGDVVRKAILAWPLSAVHSP